MYKVILAALALSLSTTNAKASCPVVDNVSNGNFVTDRLGSSVQTYAELAVAFSSLYDDIASGQEVTGAKLSYEQDSEFTRFIPNSDFDLTTAKGKCSLFTTGGLDVGYQAVLPSVAENGLQELKDKMSFPDPEPSEDFTFPEIALSVPLSNDNICQGTVNVGGIEYPTSIATDAQNSNSSLNYNEFWLFEGSDEIKQSLVTFNFKLTFQNPNNPASQCIVQPFPTATSEYLRDSDADITCDEATNKFCRKTEGNLATLFKEYKKFVNRRYESIKETFGQWLNGGFWWENWKLSNTAFRVPESLSIFPAGDRVCWEANPDGATYTVTVDHYANTELGGIIGGLTELSFPDFLGAGVDFSQQTVATFYRESEQMVNYIDGVL